MAHLYHNPEHRIDYKGKTYQLTPAEFEVFCEYAKGRMVKQIALRRKRSKKTVSVQLGNIRQAMGITTDPEFRIFAGRWQLLRELAL